VVSAKEEQIDGYCLSVYIPDFTQNTLHSLIQAIAISYLH